MNRIGLGIALAVASIACFLIIVAFLAVGGIVANSNHHNYNYVITYLSDDHVKIEFAVHRNTTEYLNALNDAFTEIRRKGHKMDFLMPNEITIVLEPKPSASSNGGT